MARVRYLEREDLPAEHRQVYDDIARSRGGVQPNFRALLNSPLAASRMAALGAYVRFETPLPARTKVLAALTSAREADGDYVWTVNEPQARSTGIDEATIQAIRARHAPQGLASEDASIVQFTQELLRQHRVADARFRRTMPRPRIHASPLARVSCWLPTPGAGRHAG